MLAVAGASLVPATAWAGNAAVPAVPMFGDGPSIRYAGGARSSGLQALSLDAMSHLRVRALICGERVSAILDTGAARTVLDRSFAERRGLALRPGFNVVGITGDAHGDYVDDISVSIGALTLDRLSPGLLDLSSLSPPVGEPTVAIIGRELFQRTAADFDFSGGTVRFADIAAPLELPSRNAVALKQSPRGTPHVPVSIDDEPIMEAGLDIGYNASVMLSPDYPGLARIVAGRPMSTVASVGAEGMSISRVVTIDRLALGGSVLGRVPVEIPSRWNRSVPAIIGFDVIRRFRLLTDYSRHRIGLFADPREMAKPLPKDRSGIGAMPAQDGLDVIHVADGSPAERCGLKPGDRIEAINGDQVDLDYIRRHPRMGTAPAGSVFVLKLDGGRSASLTLAEYY